METTTTEIAAAMREQVTAYCENNGVPGYLAGVYRGGEQVVLAHGTANRSTGAAMREDTGFLLGSVTKVLTTTLLLRHVERGLLDLDRPVVSYLPEFELTEPGAAERIRVRNLLNHTNGIDADLLFADGAGRHALRDYTAALGRQCGVLFAPEEYASYSNGGMIVAGRLLEAVTGASYPELLERELYSSVGMADSSTSARQAILRSTAVGHFPAAEGARRTEMFMLPDTWGPAGGTAIGTVADLLAFGRTHLADGISPSGTRVLSAELTALMRQPSYDLGTPNVAPIGLGWLLMPFGSARVLTMSGASPGGVALLAVAPEQDLVFVAYGNDMRAMPLHDELLLWLLTESGVRVTDLVTPSEAGELVRYAGTYRSNQLRVEVRAVDGQLEEQTHYEPFDTEQERIFRGFAGGAVSGPPQRYVPIGRDLFAPAGMPAQAFNGYLRQLLVSYHGFADGRAAYRNAGGRMTRRHYDR
ncbi:class A beta-lactamase-related serine hydrolase [Nocardia panacis]|uniref:Class A beta-lactamase-related serine hydrolase n=1 Tax=Nocardia panacis TaxID=2340916 RepID=A0A3A4K7A9_9NOCA|nr:serine hydrolase domain-containing protein [Nocardia panacis]RJO69038.1 class A beta-lactamase-related serine hydrolase [Nocardia panacis]